LFEAYLAERQLRRVGGVEDLQALVLTKQPAEQGDARRDADDDIGRAAAPAGEDRSRLDRLAEGEGEGVALLGLASDATAAVGGLQVGPERRRVVDRCRPVRGGGVGGVVGDFERVGDRALGEAPPAVCWALR
jgi:hypothetical protein